MLVPRPHSPASRAESLRDDELLAWASRVIVDVITVPTDHSSEKQEIRS
jgi:hypothetical protein